MRKVNFEEMRNELQMKEERYNGYKWLYSIIMASAKWELDKVNPEEADNKDNEELTIDDFIIPEWNEWNNYRGKYEAISQVIEYLDKLISKI